MKKPFSVFLSAFTAIILLLSLTLTAFADFENTHKNTGNAADDLTAAAETQIGYSGKKYGSEAESACFISWCAREANISKESLPSASSADELYSFYSETMHVHSASNYMPKKGDIIFLGENNAVNLCGIVSGADEKYITAVIYDTDNTVKKKMYTNGLDKIMYYASPDYDIIPNDTAGNHMTIASSLNFRKLPTTSSDIICTIPMGTIVNITEFSSDGEWGKITYNDAEGWINMQYVKPYNDNYIDSSEYSVRWNIIDVSKFQGKVDWNRVAENGINGVILRLGFRATKTKVIYTDDNFFENYNGAKNAGLHIGCYFYSAAENAAEAAEETKFVTDTIRKNNLEFDMPVYIDIEDPVTEKWGKDFITELAEQFLAGMDKENIFSGVYSNTYWLTNYYDPTIFANHSLWVADWRDKCYYTGPYGMWQYSDKGSIAGVEAENTDLSICYVNYPKLIEDSGYNREVPPNTDYQKGDPTGDGEITAADARTALRISAKLYVPSESVANAADADGNGEVSASDARKILRVSAKLESF